MPELPAGPAQREMIAQQLQPLIDKLANAPIDQVFAGLQDSMAALKQLGAAAARGLRIDADPSVRSLAGWSERADR